MVVGRDVVEARLAGEAAHEQHRHLALEAHERLERRRRAADGLERRGDLAGRLDARLALAVVAEAARLQNRRRADLGDGRGKVVGAGDRRKARDRNAQRLR